jgi:DNA-binding XRE family transcriptional regulator
LGFTTNKVVLVPIAGENVARNHKLGYCTQMLITGNQLKAARALAGIDQLAVAQAAKVAVNTIRNMESRGPNPITSGAVTLRSVQSALEAAGVEFTNGGQPGVRLRKQTQPR